MINKNIARAIGKILLPFCVASSAYALPTDLATGPLSTSSPSSVLPNLMFIMDDSGSMEWDHLPDDARDAGSSVDFKFGYYGLRSSQCNEVYYNPNITYSPPVRSDGTSYPNASFTAALPDGFKAASGSNVAVNLSSNFKAIINSSYLNAADSSGQAAYYFSYSGTQTSPAQRIYNDPASTSASTFSKECGSASGATPGANVFAKVTVTGATQQQNFANWYSYYRTRMLLMKTAAGRAFKPIGDRYRVGYLSINNNNKNTTNPDYLNISKFDQAQKDLWYSKLYNSKPSNGTPLREALGNVGRIYAGKLTSYDGATVTDPVQYSCQQNFTILSTDGYWNGDPGMQLDGSTTVGNQDSGQPRAITDGGTAIFTTKTSQTKEGKRKWLESTNQILQRKTQLQQVITQRQQKETQIQKRTYVNQKRTVTTTPSKITIIFSDAPSNSSISAITVGGGNILSGEASAGKNNNLGTRLNTLVASIASQLTKGYSATASGTCNNGTPSGCQNGDRYIVIRAPNGANDSVSVTNNNVTFRSLPSSFSGGSVSPDSWQPVASCTASSSTNSTTGVITATECQKFNDTGFQSASSCTVASGTSGNGWVTTECPNPNPIIISDWNDVPSCAESGPINGRTIFCRDKVTTQDVSSCTASGLTNGQTVACPVVETQAWTGIGSCNPSTVNGLETSCKVIKTGPTAVGTCIKQDALDTNQFIQRVCTEEIISPDAPVQSCTTVPGTVSNGYVRTTCTTTESSPVQVSSCTPVTATAENNWKTVTCTLQSTTGGVANTLADVAQYYYATDLRTSNLSNCTGAAVPPATSGNDVCLNNVPGSGSDSASWQHMTTFTLGLGARGKMLFSPTYVTDQSGDYYEIKNGNKAKAATSTTPATCSWQAAGTVCNWPVPGINSSGTEGKVENIDDLWHAAVNGRGTFFSATSPTTLATGLSNALSGVTVRVGGTAAATTSTPNIVASDNFVFASNYTSGEWSGEFFRLRLDSSTLEFTDNPDWRARRKLDDKPYADRKIYTFDPGNATTKLKEFNWDNLTPEEQAYFGMANITGTDALTQICTTDDSCLQAWKPSNPYAIGNVYRNGNTWYRVNTAYTSGTSFGSTDTSKATVIDGPAGKDLVNFLRGQRNYEGPASDTSKPFRKRAHVLGDIVSSEAAYVKLPRYKYADDGYADYKATQTQDGRIGMVYVGSNDGMLHAFKAGGTSITSGDGSGEELWAYVPSVVMPKLFKLADKNYANTHRYFVDGTPVTGDVKFDGEWHTILVGGLNGGGRGYYALDVTDPENPKALWEFIAGPTKAGYTTDANLGYTYGRPVITKLKSGQWVVLVTSGYNNISPGDGVGYLYVLDAKTGAKIGDPITTNVGGTGTPSGLGQIAQWADNPSLDNTAKRVYGTDLMGNVWRFDIDDNLGAPGNEAHRLITVKGPATTSAPSGSLQPIVTKPIPATVGSKVMIFVSTGKLLGLSDMNDMSVQSFYGIKDPLDDTTYSNPRDTNSGFVRQTLTPSVCPSGAPASTCKLGEDIRTGTANPVNLDSNNGWFLDFPDAGERANVDPALALGTLAINTNIPSNSACTFGGYSFSYYLNYANGSPLSPAVSGSTEGVAGSKLGNGLASRPVVVEGDTGKVVTISQVEGTPPSNPNGNNGGDNGGDTGGDTGGGTTDPTPEEDGGTINPNVEDTPVQQGGAGVKRVSWRELVD